MIQDKGSRFVILAKDEYQDKMLEKLNKSLHYNKLKHDPTMDYYDIVKPALINGLGRGRSLVKSQSG